MLKPKIGKTYFFVRRSGDTFEHTEFMRNEDGSANSPDAWCHALEALRQLGFQELREAQAQSAVPSTWKPD